MIYKHRPVGAQLTSENECVFRVWAPQMKSVEVVILESKDAIHNMNQEDFGYWSTSISNVDPGTPYLFQLDGEKKLPDPASRWQPHGVHGPSAVLTDRFSWSDGNWKGI